MIFGNKYLGANEERGIMNLLFDTLRENEHDQLVKLLNGVIGLCEPIKYSDLNKIFKVKDNKKLLDFAASYQHRIPKVCYENINNNPVISVVGIMNTILSVFCGSAAGLQFNVDSNGVIIDVSLEE